MKATAHTPVAVITCPACEIDLPFEAHPINDWKRGTVTLEIILSEEASVHLAEHFGGAPIDDGTDAPDELALLGSPDTVPVGAEPAADPAEKAVPEPPAEPAQEAPEEAPAKPVSKTRKAPKTAE